MTVETIAPVVSVLAALLAGATVIVAFRTFRRPVTGDFAVKQNPFPDRADKTSLTGAVLLLSQAMGGEYTISRDLLEEFYDSIPTEKLSDEDNTLKLILDDKKLRNAALRVLRYYECLAASIIEGAADERLPYTVLVGVLLNDWEILRPFVKFMQAKVPWRFILTSKLHDAWVNDRPLNSASNIADLVGITEVFKNNQGAFDRTILHDKSRISSISNN